MKIEIHIKLKEYVPIIERICKKYIFSEKLKAIKFQGKPVNIKLLITSIVPNVTEKIRNEEVIFFQFFILKTLLLHSLFFQLYMPLLNLLEGLFLLVFHGI